MRRSVAIALGALLLTKAAWPKKAQMDTRPRRTTDLPRPHDPDVAVKEELEAARRMRTIAAYDNLIARHPDHPLAVVARRERESLSSRRH